MQRTGGKRYADVCLKAEGIFEKVIAIKYDVPNGELQLLDMYKVDIDRFYDTVIEKNA